MGLVRRKRTEIVRLLGKPNSYAKSGSAVLPRQRRRGKWKPLGDKHHVPSDPTLLRVARFLKDGKCTLIDLARRAAITDQRMEWLIEKWDALTPSAQKVATLTDLCKFSEVSPARFIAATARAGCEIDNHCVIIALSNGNIPAEVELAVRNEFDWRNSHAPIPGGRSMVG